MALAVAGLVAASGACLVVLGAFASDDVYDGDPGVEGLLLGATTLGWLTANVFAVLTRHVPRRLSSLAGCLALVAAWLLLTGDWDRLGAAG